MAGNTTSNTSATIRAQVYSSMILDTLKDGFLPEGIHRDVSDFPDGTTLNIPTFGDVVLRDITEDMDVPVDALDTGSITLTITEHKGAGSYLTDNMKEDSYISAQFDAAIVPKHLRALKEAYETSLLAAVPDGQTAANANAINGFAHRFVASGSNQTMTLEDFAYAKLSLDKANAPEEGRIAIVDGLVEMTFNTQTNLVNVSNNPMFEGVVNSGFGKAMRFYKNIYGFDVYLSNRLKHVDSETVDTSSISVPAPSSSAAVTSGVANLFLCVADDMSTPIMGAWRRQPRTEPHRNVPKMRDEFYTTARWGHGLQRTQTAVVVLTSRTAYK